MAVELRAAIVCVDFSDFLEVTLSRNIRHFAETMVITTPGDERTIEVASRLGAQVHRTEAFYAKGAMFNKWAALEEGLTQFGRHGFLALVDADIVWPESLGDWEPELGKLCCPVRRDLPEGVWEIPPDKDWESIKPHPYQRLPSGHTMIFHASDPRLKGCPWHDTNWKHAGGADGNFARRWSSKRWVRPWSCLHLGAPKQWCGRYQPDRDGNLPVEASKKQANMDRILRHLRMDRFGYFSDRLPDWR